MINYRGGLKSSISGNSLSFSSASRAHIGAYFCIASNGVPPSISKRIDLRVQCRSILFKYIEFYFNFPYQRF